MAAKLESDINEANKNDGAVQEASTDTSMSPPNVEEA